MRGNGGKKKMSIPLKFAVFCRYTCSLWVECVTPTKRHNRLVCQSCLLSSKGVGSLCGTLPRTEIIRVFHENDTNIDKIIAVKST
jgi:hypothetical protein